MLSKKLGNADVDNGLDNLITAMNRMRNERKEEKNQHSRRLLRIYATTVGQKSKNTNVLEGNQSERA